MRPALLLILSLAVLSSAHAQSRTPAVTRVALPLDVRATLARTGEHACSQSYASSRSTGTIALTIDRTGAAHLALDGTYAQHMGPSPGRYMQGDRSSSDTQQRHHAEWSGMATIAGQGVVIAFDHVDSAELYFSGATPPTLPPSTPAPVTLGLRCAIASSDVFPAIETAGEMGVPTRLLSCEWTGDVPSPVMFYVSGNMALGAGPGVSVTSTETMWSTQPAQQIRFLP
jgi:hypothetical protein